MAKQKLEINDESLTSLFIEKSKKIHGNKYDYSQSIFTKARNKVKIICPTHGLFEQVAFSHYKTGQGCGKCYKENRAGKTLKLNNSDFIERCKKIHGDKYDYSLVEYKNTFIKVKIICNKHGVFEQIPMNHMNKKCGCPFCRVSKGEMSIKNWLDTNNFDYIHQYKFDDCKSIKKLVFDFYLPKNNLCIEYDGEQHTKEKSFFGGSIGLEKIKKRDNIKDNYCNSNNIKLLRIKHNESIENKLNKVLK
jgi:very-short-patch-repair endonuclease